MKTGPDRKRMSHILVLTHASLAEQPYGGAQRVTALLDAIGEPALLCQPGRSHPRHEVWSYPRDFGKKKFLINWGIFNFYWPSNAQRVRDALARRQIAAAVLTSIWNYHPLRDTPGLPKVLDAQNVEARAIGERFGHHHPFTRMVHAHEARVLQAMDRVCACSEVDRELFVDSYGLDPAHVSVVPNGVHLRPAADAHLPAELPNEWNERLGAATVLFFMGKLDYQPNRAALQFMSDSLLPELERRAPGRFKILVCGDPHPPGSFHHAMLFAGRVPTLTPYLQRRTSVSPHWLPGLVLVSRFSNIWRRRRRWFQLRRGQKGWRASPGPIYWSPNYATSPPPCSRLLMTVSVLPRSGAPVARW